MAATMSFAMASQFQTLEPAHCRFWVCVCPRPVEARCLFLLCCASEESSLRRDKPGGGALPHNLSLPVSRPPQDLARKCIGRFASIDNRHAVHQHILHAFGELIGIFKRGAVG